MSDRTSILAFTIAAITVLLPAATPTTHQPTPAITVYEDGSGHTTNGKTFCLPHHLCERD